MKAEALGIKIALALLERIKYGGAQLRLNCLLFTVVIGISACISHPSAPVSDLSPVDKNQTHYTVKRGDTLHAISFRTGISYQHLAAWNNIRSPYRIYVGDKLSLNVAAKPVLAERQLRAIKPKSDLASKPIPPVKLPTTVVGWRWPAKGKLSQTFSRSKARFGIHIKAKRASRIVSAATGQVVYAGEAIKGYGALVIVKHSAQYISAYAHNDTILVKEGEYVKAGQVLAKMGSSGTKGVKLHFEIRRDGEPVDPLKFLPRKRA